MQKRFLPSVVREIYVDGLVARGAQLCDRIGEITDVERDVVKTFAASREEPVQEAFAMQRLEELDLSAG